MHGRVKVRTTEEQKEKIRQDKCKKGKAYRNSMQIILEKRESGIHDQETLDLTWNLLVNYPDVITLWNYRREILLEMKNDDDLDGYQKLLEKDLNLTEQCLRVNPKSYGSWHHRIWTLDNMPQPNWERELNLCTKYLKLDERNFHCWDYRRTVAQRSNIPNISEYEFTLEKIKTNFSNYSAWHLRSKLLPKIFPDSEKKFPINEIKHKEELELVESAAFTDPNDQSAWFYQRWLLGLTEPKVSFVYVEANEDVFIVTSKSIKVDDAFKFGVTIAININDEPSNGVWTNYGDDGMQSSIWKFNPEPKIKPTDTVTVKLLEYGNEYYQEQLKATECKTYKANFLPTFTPNLKETLESQLLSCEQLLELEPESKWTLLTSIFLMLSIDSVKYQNQILSILQKLCEIDSLRKGYYQDLRSKILIQYAITHHYEEKHLNESKKFVLSNQNLTCFYHSQYLHNCEEINLSCNSICSKSLNQFKFLLNCKSLNLSKNEISNLNDLPVMPNLEILILDDNKVEEIDFDHMGKFPRLVNMSLTNNPITEKKESLEGLIKLLSKVKLNICGSK